MIKINPQKDKISISRRGVLGGFDGHSLRAYSYFPEQMPDIETVQEGVECYKAKVGDTYIYFHADEQIEYLGKIMTGKSLYELVAEEPTT